MQTTEMNFLSWFKTSDVYDPDRARYRTKRRSASITCRYGYADFRITNTDVAYQDDPAGYVITITVDEGPQYHVSGATVTSHLAKVDSAFARSVRHAARRRRLQRDRGREGGRGRSRANWRGTATPSPTCARTANATTQRTRSRSPSPSTTGPKVYIERIDIVGNTRTRDYVIRREFDIGEGDPYNHALVERGERRLNRLGFFKTVHISTRPGSTPDRVIVTVEVEDQPTGSVSCQRRLFDDRRRPRRSRVHGNQLPRPRPICEGQRLAKANTAAAGASTFTEPYFLDQRLAAGFDLFHKEQDQNHVGAL